MSVMQQMIQASIDKTLMQMWIFGTIFALFFIVLIYVRYIYSDKKDYNDMTDFEKEMEDERIEWEYNLRRKSAARVKCRCGSTWVTSKNTSVCYKCNRLVYK